MRKTTRNQQIHDYVTQKFKSQKTSNPKHPFCINYINLKRGNKSLSNTILLIYNSMACHNHSKINKKGYEHYVEVVFAGLHQPSKEIDSNLFKILKAFLKRFKVHSIDMACDFDYQGRLKDLLRQTSTLMDYAMKGARIRNEGDSLYINETISTQGLKRILLYDKYKKQTLYHKENIHPELVDWKRLEITLQIRERFFKWIESDGLNGGIDLLNDMSMKMGIRSIVGLEVEVLSKQIRKLKDLRRAISFKAWAKVPIKNKKK
ncbi:hypothetical protein BKH44_08370 [Helicobacter sp. 13S00477-4]|nr:hypothetical protein BKH44_08370 [Helicobacter sp. 13S00477-4]